MPAIIREEQNKIRKYLLGDLTDAIEERVEVRLLSDDDYAEELEIIEEELIDQYLEDELAADERQRFEQYFLSTAGRKRKLRFARALKKQKLPLVFHKQQLSRFLKLYVPVAALLLLVLGFGVWRLCFYQSDVDKGLLALQKAYQARRPVEARLTGFDYAPATNLRGAQEKADYVPRDRAASLLLGAVSDNPVAKSYHALGKYYLAEHQFEKAIDQLKSALSLAPQNARIHSDLGAALLEEGKIHNAEGQGIEEFASSLEHLNKALELDDTLLEALFNRALLHEQMMLPQQALDDWHKYLENDANSRWAEEARQHLKLLESQRQKTSQSDEEIFQDFLKAYKSLNDEAAWQIISSYHHRTGNVVVEQLLDNYLELATTERKDDASSRLQMLSYVGELARRKSGDKFFSDLAQFYSSVLPEQRATLIAARHLMKSAHAGWGQSKVEESLELFSKAKQSFEQANDVCEARVAEYWLGFCYYREYKQKESLETFERLEQACAQSLYQWLRARALYGISSVRLDLNEYSKALESGRQSLEVAEQINDATGTLSALTLLIEYHRSLGDYPQALSYIQKSLPLVNSISLDPLQGCRHYGFAATTFASLNLYAAAAEYQKEAVRFAVNAGNPTAMSVNYAFLGMMYGRLRRYEEAVQHLGHALEIAEGRANESAGQEMVAYAHLLMGHLYREAGDLPQAVASYNRSIDGYGQLNLPTFLYQAHKGRLLCYTAQQDDAAVKAEIETTLNLVEQNRANIFEEDSRNQFFDIEQSVYDLAINFEYSRMNDSRKAFEYSEFSRARSLLESLNSEAQLSAQGQPQPDAVSQPLSLSEIQRRMPEQAQVLQYAVLENRLLIWSITSTTVSGAATEISQEELSEKVLGYLKTVSGASETNEDEALRRAKELYEVLIKPIESSLDRNKQLCIIPDKILNYLPYAALVSPASGKYLIEDYLLLVSPSSTVFVACSDIAAQKDTGREERLLSVGNPSFDRAAYPKLSDLPAAQREAREVSSYYHSSSTLLGEQARVNQVKKEMERAEVVHLASHSVLDERFHLRSKLLLAKETGADGEQAEGVLSGSEIQHLNLSKARLVVLSACQTAAERYYGGEGMIGMARPFIAAGVPLVTASLWPVDSDSAAELMIKFHQYRKRENLPTAEALRRAQLEMLKGRERTFSSPFHWASFVVIGGYARY